MSERRIRARIQKRIADPQSGFGEITLIRWLIAAHIGTLVITLTPGISELLALRVAVVFIDLTFVPGILFLVAIDEFSLDLDHLLFAVGASLLLVMATGVVINIFLPLIGITEPLSLPFLALGTTILVGGLAYLAYRRSEESNRTMNLGWLYDRRITPIVPFLLLLLPATILAIDALQRFDDNLPIIVVLSVIAITPLILVYVRCSDWYPLGVWGMSVSLLYHATLSSQAFGGSSIPMHIMQVNRWTPGVGEVASTTTSLVPNGVLYPAYATLSGIPYYLQTSFVNPLLVSLLPVILFQMYRRYVSDTAALLGASIFVFAHPFYRLYPGGGRVATPVFFLALVGLLMASDEVNESRKKVLSLMFATGIVVSHYGTSYFAMLAFVGAYLLLKALPMLEHLFETARSQRDVKTVKIFRFSKHRAGTPVLTASFIGFFVVLVLGWYLFTAGGIHFSLPKHIYVSVVSLFEGNFLTGSTANRVQKSYGYGTMSIRLSRLVYIGLVTLMGIGLTMEIGKRILPSRQTLFQDEYLAVSGMLMAFAGSSFLIPVGWGGGRPMMIAFTFVGVFAVTGLLIPLRLARKPFQFRLVHFKPLSGRALETVSFSPFGIILAIFLVLNTGVLAATVVGGTAPKNVPIQTEIEDSRNPAFNSRAYVKSDVQTFAWVADHRSPEYGMRGDLITNGLTDKYRFSIALAMEKDVVFPYSEVKPRGYLNRLGKRSSTSYVFLLGHNIHLDIYTLNSTYERKPLEPLHDKLRRRSQIYTTSESAVYFGGFRNTEL